MDNFSKELVTSNLIGLNPTGILTLKNSKLESNGNNNIIMNTETASKENLKKAQDNEIICSNLETFKSLENYYIENIRNNCSKNNFNKNNCNKNNFNKNIRNKKLIDSFLLIILIIILLIILNKF